MKFPHVFENIVALAWVGLSLTAAPATTAQTVISNETLVTTTFVVNKQSATAKCGNKGCRAKRVMFTPISVTCPASTGQTCTFHISLDAKTSISFKCGQNGCFGQGPIGFYQFLVDGIAPSIGPTEGDGDYLFENNVFTHSNDSGNAFENRQSFPASVLATVTNTSSNSHMIAVSVGYSDRNNNLLGCSATSYWSTMRVDVFEP
jgi:hypothetical protein